MMLYMENNDTCIVTHNGRNIVWRVNNLKNSKLHAKPKLFDEVNQWLSGQSTDVQQSLFDIYQSINAIFLDSTTPFLKQHQEATDLVTELFKHIPMNSIQYWVRYRLNIVIPPNMKVEYEITDTVKERTYLRDEYYGLIVLTLMCRFMIPIWGAYMTSFSYDIGTYEKEYMAYRLLVNTDIPGSEPFERLISYIQASIQQAGGGVRSFGGSTVISGISTLETPLFIMSKLLIRRLATGDIDATNGGGNIIANVHSFVSNTPTDLQRWFDNIRDKIKDEDEGGSAPDARSILEQYKNSQQLSEGDKAIHRYFLSNVQKVVMQADPTIDLLKLEECLACYDKIQTMPIAKHNEILVQWALGDVIPVTACYMLDKKEMLRLMLATQALLWHWGFNALALMVTATVNTNITIEFNRTRNQVKQQDMSILNTIYPYENRSGGAANRNRNIAYQALMSFEKRYYNLYFQPVPPAGLMAYYRESHVNENGWVCPSDLMVQLSNLLIKVQGDE